MWDLEILWYESLCRSTYKLQVCEQAKKKVWAKKMRMSSVIHYHDASLLSLFACCTCAKWWLHKVMDVPWVFFFPAAVAPEGVTAAWDKAIYVSSDANPGIQILWLCSKRQSNGYKNKEEELEERSLTLSVSLLQCFASWQLKFMTELMNMSVIWRSSCRWYNEG